MAQIWEDEETTDLVELPPSPTMMTGGATGLQWRAAPPLDSSPTLAERWVARIEASSARAASFPTSKLDMRHLDLWFAMAASAAFGAISVIALLELAS